MTLTKGDKKLRLLAVHLKSGCLSEHLDPNSLYAMPNSTYREDMKHKACEKLSKQIEPLESWIDQRAAEDLPFIVLGDFNRRFSTEFKSNYSEKSGLWQAIDDDAAENMWTPTLTMKSECWGGYYKDYVDHIVLDPRSKKKLVDGSFQQLLFKEKYSMKLSQTLSDHCPISVRLIL